MILRKKYRSQFFLFSDVHGLGAEGLQTGWRRHKVIIMLVLLRIRNSLNKASLIQRAVVASV